MRQRLGPATIAAAVMFFGAFFGATAPPARAADSCGPDSATLGDGGFETPTVDTGTYVQLDSSLVPPWLTTDSINEVELWETGFLGVPAAEGTQFAELNANSPGTLYQDVVTTSGEKMTWTLDHRGREGDDTMRVLIGDATTADVTSDTGWNYFSADLTDGTDAWGTHTASYVVPVGQVCTRFAFRAVSAAGGNPSIGNFLDAVSFAVTVPPTPSPRPSPSAALTPRPTPPGTSTVSPPPGANPTPAWLALMILGSVTLVAGVAGWRNRSRRAR